MRLPGFAIFLRSALLLFFVPSTQAALNFQDIATPTAPMELEPGVVVEKIEKSFAAEKAGLKEGDIVMSWAARDARGQIESPFDLAQLVIEEGPRGVVTLEGLRGNDRKAWVLAQESWGLSTRPNLPAASLSIYREGQDLVRAGKLVEASQRWRVLALQSRGFHPPWLSAWVFFRAAEIWSAVGQWKETDAAYGEAMRRSAGSSPAITAQLLRSWAFSFEQRREWTHAENYYHQALAESEKLGRQSLTVAVSLNSLGRVFADAGDLPTALGYFRRALKIREKLTPGSLGVAYSLNGLGNVAYKQADLALAEDCYRRALAIGKAISPVSYMVAGDLGNLSLVAQDREDLANAEEYAQQALVIHKELGAESLEVASSLAQLGGTFALKGDLAKAEEHLRAALALREKLAPGSLSVASNLNYLGIVVGDRGDLEQAEAYMRQSLAIREKLVPGGLLVASSLNLLGLAVRERGDLVKAEEYFRRALSINARLAPGSLELSATLHDIGTLAEERGDLVTAEEYLRRALNIRKKVAPDGLNVAWSLSSIGNLVRDQGDLAKAEDYYNRALAIQQKLDPDGPMVALSLYQIGTILEGRKDLKGAEEHYRQALAINQRSAGSLWAADNLHQLGEVARSRGEMDKAEEYYRQALAIREKAIPGSRSHAETLAALAITMRKKGQPEVSAQLFEQALGALENQIARLGGGGEAHSGFRARHAGYYKDYIDLLLAQNHPASALEVAERFRARTLLETLAEARVDIRKGASSSLVEREQSLQEAFRALSDRRLRVLGGKHTNEQAAGISEQIRRLLAQYQQVEDEIRADSPAYAALTQPQSLNAATIQQQLLDNGTLLLEYLLGDEDSYLWAVTSHSLDVHRLPKRSEIEKLARRAYNLLTARNHETKGETDQQRQARWRRAEAEYPKVAAELAQMILGPVSSDLQGKRLLIVSDGALAYIPFAVLPAPGVSARKAAPLVLEHEVVSLPSASVLALLRQQAMGRPQAPKAVAVLADPVFDKLDPRVAHGGRAPGVKEEPIVWAAHRLTRSLSDVNGQLHLGRLPFTRLEAEQILAVTPPGKGLLAMDFRASRTTATSPQLGEYRIVHFATHGILDSEHPELSGLVLSLVDRNGNAQNGFLELQDIYNLNLPVDLVVLSACETGLGKEISGEGLMGLTRGFMYAGASRVVASLWKVSDVATAKLMGSFYRAMERDGMRPAAALRAAQIEMWKQERWSGPYFWAAFQLEGEWK